MRITGGTHRSRHLVAPAGDGTRPTADRVREALFSILGTRVHDAAVLDLFAGTGALGLEALSRGAARAVFVEKNPKALVALRANVDALKESERVEIVRLDATTYSASREFDLVFIDPPYRLVDEPAFAKALRKWADSMLPDALCVLEHATRTAAPTVESLELEDSRIYGDTTVTFYRKAPEN